MKLYLYTVGKSRKVGELKLGEVPKYLTIIKGRACFTLDGALNDVLFSEDKGMKPHVKRDYRGENTRGIMGIRSIKGKAKLTTILGERRASIAVWKLE